MDGLIGQSDGLYRLVIFVGVFLLMAAIELFSPRRRLSVSRARRWLTNLDIAGVDTVVLRAMAALAVPVAAALYAKEHQLGLLNHADLPFWLRVVVALLVLDLAIWAQHLASHKVPVFWRLHEVHHADRDVDVTTAVRFHPIEIALSMLWKIAVVIALGALPFAVFVFEVILNASAMFNHVNIACSHGSIALCGSSSSRWICTVCTIRCCMRSMTALMASTRRFGIACSERIARGPEAGQQGMTLGLPPYQSEAPTRFAWSLWLSFGSQQARND